MRMDGIDNMNGMMPEPEEVIRQVEELHASMVKIKMSRGLTHPEVVNASHLLDDVLNEYREVINKSCWCQSQ